MKSTEVLGKMKTTEPVMAWKAGKHTNLIAFAQTCSKDLSNLIIIMKTGSLRSRFQMDSTQTQMRKEHEG